MKNYELSDEKAELIVTALRSAAYVSRDAGCDDQANAFHDIADEINAKLYPKKPSTGGLICGQGESNG